MFEGLVLLRPLRLPGNDVQLRLDFADDVVEPQQVLLGRLQLPDRRLLAALVLGDAGGFFDELPPLLRFGLHQGGDAVLLHEGIGPGADARSHEKFPDIQKTAGNLVDRVFAFSFAVEASRDHDLAELRIGPRKLLLIRHERHGNLGHADGAGLLGAVEDDVVHLLAAEGPDPLLAHDPADRIGDVALAAAVRTDDAADSGGEVDDDLVPEGFETGYFQLLKSHLL